MLEDVVVVVLAPAEGKLKPDEEDGADGKPLPKSTEAVVAAVFVVAGVPIEDEADGKPVPKSASAAVFVVAGATVEVDGKPVPKSAGAVVFVVAGATAEDEADGKPLPNENPPLLATIGKVVLLLNVAADVAGEALKLNGFETEDAAGAAAAMVDEADDAANAVNDGAEELVPKANESGLSKRAFGAVEGIDVAVAVVVRGLENEPKTIGAEVLGTGAVTVVVTAVDAAGVLLVDVVGTPKDGNVELLLVPIEKGFNAADVAGTPKAGVTVDEGNAGNKEALVVTGGAIEALSLVVVGKGTAAVTPNEGTVLAKPNDGAVVVLEGIEKRFSFVVVGSENVTVDVFVLGIDATVVAAGVGATVLAADVVTTGSSTIISGSVLTATGF